MEVASALADDDITIRRCCWPASPAERKGRLGVPIKVTLKFTTATASHLFPASGPSFVHCCYPPLDFFCLAQYSLS